MSWCVRENDLAEEKEENMAENAYKHVVILNILVMNKTQKALKDVWERTEVLEYVGVQLGDH